MALSGDQASSYHQDIETEQSLTTAIGKELLALASKTQDALNASIHSAAAVANDTLSAAESAVVSHFDNASSSFIAQIDEGSVVSEDDGSVLIIYVAIFVSLGGLVVAGLVSFLVWYWCRRSASREKRLLEGRCGMERAAMTEAQKKEALFKEIRRDIAAVENDGFLRHLEVYMLPQYAGHPNHFQSNHSASCFHPQQQQGAHRVYDPYLPPHPPSQYRPPSSSSNRTSHHHHHRQHNKNSTSNVQVSNSTSMKPSSKNYSQSFLVTSPLSSTSSASHITRSSTMTTTASSISSYSSSASSTLSHQHRNPATKRLQHDVLAPMISDNGEAAQTWGEEEDDDLVSDHH